MMMNAATILWLEGQMQRSGYLAVNMAIDFPMEER